MARGTGEPADPGEDQQDEKQVFQFDEATKTFVVSKEARRAWSKENPKMFTPDLGLLIIVYVGTGGYLETAAEMAGIGRTTLYAWRERAKSPSSTPELRSWMRAIEMVMAVREMGVVGLILAAAKAGSWQAGAWYLERKYPDRWGRRDHMVHTGIVNGTTQTEPSAAEKLARMNSEQRQKTIRELMAKAGVAVVQTMPVSSDDQPS